MINGIKPTLTKTTELRIKPTSFDGAMDVFCQKLEKTNSNCINIAGKFSLNEELVLITHLKLMIKSSSL